MKAYLTLFFPSDVPAKIRLKKWLMKMGSELHAGDPLFTYQSDNHENRFSTPAAGNLKVYLLREGELLGPGSEVAVLSLPQEQAEEMRKRGLGKILNPEEYKHALEHAEAASIRLPPEQF